jgi:hypothetical protein
MLGYYSYLECQVFHLLKETGFPKQVEMLPGYTWISRGVAKKVAIVVLGCLVIILIWSAKFSTFLYKETGEMLPGYTRIITCW